MRLPLPLQQERAGGEGPLQVAEPDARYLATRQPALLEHFDLLATAPGGVARLRGLILTLAVQGKLVPQDPADEPASRLLERIRAEKARLVKDGKIRKEKPLAEIVEEEKPFQLPAAWEWAGLPEVTFNWGQTTPSEQFTYIDVAAIDNQRGRITDGVQVIEAADAPSRARKIVKQGTVIYSTVRPYLKNIAVVETEYIPPAIASTAFAVMHSHEGLLPQYLLIYLQSKPFTDFVSSKMVGIAYPAINDANFFLGVISLPPTREQSRIVARVDELMQLCDALEAQGRLEAEHHARLTGALFDALAASESAHALAENWQRVAAHFDLLLDRPEAVDALEQTILQLAVRGLLVPQDPTDEPASVLLQEIRAEKDRLIAAGKIKRDKPLPPIADEETPFELPRGWEWARAEAVLSLLNGYAFRSECFKPSGIRLLRNINVSHGELDWSQAAHLDCESAQEFDRFLLEVGDIVLSLDRPLISTGLKYAVVREEDLPCLLLQRVAKLSPARRVITPPFVELWLQSELFTTAIDPGRSNGVPHISTKQVEGMLLPIPPIPEQSRIVDRVTELRSLCAALRQRLAAARQTQSRLAEALADSVSA